MKIVLIPLLLASVFLSVSCRVIPPDSPQEPKEHRNDSAAIALGNKLLTSIRENDFRMFSECLKNGPASQMTLQDFKTSGKNMNEMFGKLQSFEFLSSLKTPAVKNLIWKRVDKVSGNIKCVH